MTTQSTKTRRNCHRVKAFIVMCMAMAVTTVSMTHWPILIYAAAPCYFVAFLLFFAGQIQKQSSIDEPEPVDRNGWFCEQKRKKQQGLWAALGFGAGQL